MRTVIALTVSSMLLGACSGTAPCSSCPKVEGTYLMTYTGAATNQGDCTALMPPMEPMTVQLTRGGAELTTTLATIPCHGTLADSADFSLSGSAVYGDGGVRTVRLTGYFVVGDAADGGTSTLNGKWSTTTDDGLGKTCATEHACSGTRL